MLKKELRIKNISLRNSITTEHISEQSLKLANTLLTLPIWNFSYYHLFLPITEKKEVDTHYILSILQGKDKDIVLPKMVDDQKLMHFLLTDNRVGYGKGFYDIFLKECNPNVVKIGLSLFEAEEIIDDISPNDVPLDYCVTPNKVYTF